MDFQTYQSYDGLGLAKLVKDKNVSANELLDVAFGRLEEINPRINAVIRSRQDKVYNELANSNQYAPFFGVPILLKDISQALKGEVLSSGSKLLKQNISSRDSHFVSKLREAGFLFIGHTNTPEFGLKNITEPTEYGATRNPWNLNHSPGGSSGGAAAAVAAGIVPIAGASDGGGSIRIPAGFTGLFGLKPTRGRTPVGPGAGRQWQGASIDFVLSRSVRDSAALLDLLQTIQPAAAFHTPLFPDSYLDLVQKPVKKRYRIAFTTASPVRTPVSEAAKSAVGKMVDWLEKEGHVVEEVEAPIDGVKMMEYYYVMNCGEMNRVVSQLEQQMGRVLTLKDIEIFTWVLHKAGESVTAAAYSEALHGWDIAAEQMAQFHRYYDFYLTPTNANAAPKVGELTPTELEVEQLTLIEELAPLRQQELVYQMFLPSLTYTPYTQLANLTGQPAMSVPISKNNQGLPIGVQFLASKGREDLLLALASQIEQSDLWLERLNSTPKPNVLKA
ncbi:amidase [Amphibacillus sediminis]|uniref:amidase n=1 Tax=Amphibacillus sediminis TaxID=360185 RepID=UPI00082FA1BD|nr:amidase [Amphibacillus sediminis]